MSHLSGLASSGKGDGDLRFWIWDLRFVIDGLTLVLVVVLVIVLEHAAWYLLTPSFTSLSSFAVKHPALRVFSFVVPLGALGVLAVQSFSRTRTRTV
jgi:hypothetical protein